MTRILVAEDNPVNRAVLLAQLKKLGYLADAVFDGKEVIEALKKYEYDIILMDCQMPTMDGFEATDEIRRNESKLNHTTIIAMTANALVGEREKCLSAGMDDYLSKPVRIATLKETLERWAISEVMETKIQTEHRSPFSLENANKIVDFSILEGFREFQRPDEPDLVSKLIQLFITDTARRLLVLRQAVIEANPILIKREAHNARGGAGNIGALQMARLCQELEQKASQTNEAQELISQIELEFKDVRAVLDSLMQADKN